MENQTALITGIHTGLGHALTQSCLNRGWSVFGISRHEPIDLTHTTQLQFAALDLTLFEHIRGTIDTLLHGVNQLDYVFLNAGVLGEIKTLDETSLTELRSVMDINVWANKVIIDSLFQQSINIGQIIAISSGAAVNGSGGWGPYSISKSALNLLIRVYSHEHPEVHFVSLAPGVFETNMIKTILSCPENPRFEANQRIRRAYDSHQIMTPETAAENIISKLPGLKNYTSGSFIDVRNI